MKSISQRLVTMLKKSAEVCTGAAVVFRGARANMNYFNKTKVLPYFTPY